MDGRFVATDGANNCTIELVSIGHSIGKVLAPSRTSSERPHYVA